MSERIAWIRLVTYIGSSLILITEIYRLILIYLRFIILIPSFYSIFEAIMLWSLFGGFLSLNIGFYGLKKSYPPLLDPKEYSYKLLNKIIYTGIFIVGILLILILFPPLNVVIEEFALLFQLLNSFLWICYYSSVCTWLIAFWSFSNKVKYQEIITNRRMFLHLGLGSLLILVLIIDFIWMFFSGTPLFYFVLAYIGFTIILIFFLIFQIYFFYRATRFSFIIQG